VLLVAAAVYAGCMISPPSLMDDVDAVQAQIARNMLTSGDWVTARLDGIPYLEKAPLIYWLIAGSFQDFRRLRLGRAHSHGARAMALAWLTAAFGMWAFGRQAGFYAGLCISTCFGLFLFTRILIPDVMLTASIALSMWAFLRAIDEAEPRPRWWAFVLAASLGTSLLFKSLVGVVFPVGAAFIYLGVTGSCSSAKSGRRCIPQRF
jgi:4-amino-4-deoxy-L-arabinose transferase-like glycosyltransferase